MNSVVVPRVELLTYKVCTLGEDLGVHEQVPGADLHGGDDHDGGPTHASAQTVVLRPNHQYKD